MDTDHDKIIRLEEKADALSTVVYEIKDNHLTHLKEDVNNLTKKVDSLNTKLAIWSGAIIVGIWFVDKLFK